MQRALAVHIVKQGLQSGLSKFFGRATRVALIYSAEPTQPEDFFVYDSTGLLDKHRTAIKNFFDNADAVKSKTSILIPCDTIRFIPDIAPELYCLVQQSPEVFYHFWFLERPVTDSPTTILDEWIKFAQIPLLRSDKEMHFKAQIGGGRLAEHAAFDVIREVVMQQMFPRTLSGGLHDADNVLESLLEIATIKEEGAGCSGTLAIFDNDPSRSPTVDYPLQSPVSIEKFKHVRKFLTATNSDFHLVAVAGTIVGFSHRQSLTTPLRAVFEKGHITLFLFDVPLCQVKSGNFKAIESKWSLNIQNETSSLSRLTQEQKNDLQQFVDKLVTTARNEHFGCTLLLDSGDVETRCLSGQHLSKPVPLNTNTFRFFADMCKVDGAVHIDAQSLNLRAFACLLDGQAGPTEEL